MVKSIKSVVLFLIGITAFHAVNAQDTLSEPIKVTGYVYEAIGQEPDSLIPLIGISVINLRNHDGTATGRNGYFSMVAYPGDTLFFRSITHVPDTYRIAVGETETRIFLRVKLRRATLSLKEANVYAISYNTFKHEVLNMEPKDTETIQLPKSYLGYVEPNQSLAIIRFSPFTAIYNNFSKAGREQKKLSKLLAEDKRREFLDSVYRRKIVVNFLALPPEEMDSFIDYCNLSPEFIMKLNDYELLLALSECFEGYERKKVKFIDR
ncbi:MAG: hypothetical protein KDC92_07285 [Bacteroidetes bacterium]|nr:hypothetical protein [Bacteroidota bacterium]